MGPPPAQKHISTNVPHFVNRPPPPVYIMYFTSCPANNIYNLLVLVSQQVIKVTCCTHITSIYVSYQAMSDEVCAVNIKCAELLLSPVYLTDSLIPNPKITAYITVF